MPQETKIQGVQIVSLEGKSFTPASDKELIEVIDLAFDYRGDITLTLKDSSQIVGYIFNRDISKRRVEFFIKGNEIPQTLDYDLIATITFSGEDTAFGKSWEAWSTKSAAQREAEAERMRLEAEKKGYL